MQKQVTAPETPVRVQKKHIVLFLISCVILVVSVSGLILSISWLQNTVTSPPEPSEPLLPGEAILTALIAALAYVMAAVAVLIICTFAWGIGMILAASLAFKKQDKPKWLWICSCILTAVFTVLVIGALGLIAYVLLTLFVL